MRDLIIHHLDQDGYCSAAIVLAHHKDAEHKAVDYDDPPPRPGELRGRRVWILDYSYPPDIMHDITSEADSLIWIDHHKSAIGRVDTDKLPGKVTWVLAPNCSGCELTWAYMNPGSTDKKAEPPAIVRIISAFDLHKPMEDWERAVFLGVGVLTEDPASERWRNLLARSQQELGAVRYIGQVIMEDMKRCCSRALGHATPVKVGGVEFLATNWPRYATQICDHMREHGHERGMVWYRKGANFLVSFRGPGALKAAEHLGGGGHEEAAGAVLTPDEFARHVYFK